MATFDWLLAVDRPSYLLFIIYLIWSVLLIEQFKLKTNYIYIYIHIFDQSVGNLLIRKMMNEFWSSVRPLSQRTCRPSPWQVKLASTHFVISWSWTMYTKVNRNWISTWPRISLFTIHSPNLQLVSIWLIKGQKIERGPPFIPKFRLKLPSY